MTEHYAEADLQAAARVGEQAGSDRDLALDRSRPVVLQHLAAVLVTLLGAT